MGCFQSTPQTRASGAAKESSCVSFNGANGGKNDTSSPNNLDNIVDDQGILNQLVSRQLSTMSHYSLRSESGSIVIEPEDGSAGHKIIKRIGKGGFGNVYLGEWEDKRVAVKVVAGRLPQGPEEDEAASWEAKKEKMAQMEAVLMCSINHPNIVKTFKVTSYSGGVLDDDKKSDRGGGDSGTDAGTQFEWHIIMEFCDKSSLQRALDIKKFHDPVDALHVRLDMWSVLETLKEVLQALIFLQERRILHGDLKAANVLLASNDLDRRGFIAKISDFGLSRVLKPELNHICTQTFGTVTHMPPELLASGIMSPSADVYALGILMWELYTAERVFKTMSDGEVIVAVVTKRLRPTFPSDVPAEYKALAEKCWAELSEDRPTLEQVLAEMDAVQTTLCPKGQDSPPLVVQASSVRRRRASVGGGSQQQQGGAQNKQTRRASAEPVGVVDATQSNTKAAAKPLQVAQPATSNTRPVQKIVI